MLSKTNSVSCGPYSFQPTRYNDDGDLYCKIVKMDKYKNFVHEKCKLTGLYHFDTNKFEIIYAYKDFLNVKHKKMINKFLKEYDWL